MRTAHPRSRDAMSCRSLPRGNPGEKNRVARGDEFLGLKRRRRRGSQSLSQHLPDVFIYLSVGLLQRFYFLVEFRLAFASNFHMLRLARQTRLSVGVPELLLHRVVAAADRIELQ